MVAPCMRWATAQTWWMSGRSSGLGLIHTPTRSRSCVWCVCVCVCVCVRTSLILTVQNALRLFLTMQILTTQQQAQGLYPHLGSRCLQGEEGSRTFQSSYTESRDSSCPHKRVIGGQPFHRGGNLATIGQT